MRKAQALFLAVRRKSEIVAVGALLVAYTDGRIGTQIYPIGSADPDGDILKAVEHALPTGEQNCSLKLLTPYDSWRAGDPSNKGNHYGGRM